MIDLLLAKLGRWSCPWCHTSRPAPLSDLLAILLGGFKWMSRYDYWVGTQGLRLHRKHVMEVM